MRYHRLQAVVFLVFLLCPDARTYASQPFIDGHTTCSVTKETNVPAKMRDGVILRADVFRPKTEDKVPIILMRTQYGKGAAQIEPARFQTPQWFASHCYIVVIQDIRGQYASDGTFYEYVHDRNDGYDTVEWAAHLRGSNGKVGMYGSSYVGATQWLAATATPPSLKTIVPSNTASDYYDGWTYEDGAFRLAFIEPWMMGIAATAAAQRKDVSAWAQLSTAHSNPAKWLLYRPYNSVPPLQPGNPTVAPYFFDAIRHPNDDAYWRAFAIEGHYDKVMVPVLAFEGWYDAFLNGALRNFTGMREHGGNEIARNSQRIVIGPWEHLGWGRPDSPVSPRLKALGPVANSPVNELMIAWFDHFLKGADNRVSTGPRVDYFEMGENRWHEAKEWPLAATQFRKWYLASAGHAASLMGDGVLTTSRQDGATQNEAHAATEMGAPIISRTADFPLDQYTYDPSDPVPSIGGHSCCAWMSGPQGQFDQSAIEQRADILVYSSAPLDLPLEVTGPITVTLYAKSSASDTDFTAKLVDVFPDGTAVNLSNGIQRASFRDSLTHPTLITPQKVYAYTIHVWPISNLFLKGHRIRLEISSSDFPQFAPNPNTGKPFGTSRQWIEAHQTILHSERYPSSVTLPVIPAGVSGDGENRPPQR